MTREFTPSQFHREQYFEGLNAGKSPNCVTRKLFWTESFE